MTHRHISLEERFGAKWCRTCRRTHPVIRQAVPEKPTDYYGELARDLVAILFVIGCVLLWTVAA